MRRVLLAAIALAAFAGLLLWRRSQSGGAVSLPAPTGPVMPAPARPSPPPPSPARGPTREELYARAQELGIKGRSKMSKAELEQAVANHGG